MKVLWLCNVATAEIASALNISAPVGGGWIEGAASALSQEQNIQLHICFPQTKTQQLIKGEAKGILYWGFPASKQPVHIYDARMESHLQRIVEQVQPDVVHIWGTEFPHALAMTKVFANPEKTVVNIQGLCSFYAEHYTAYLPDRVCKAWTVRDLLKRDRIVDQQKKFRLRGYFEAQTLQNAGFAVGRTRWDQACAGQLAPNIQYRTCNETLRQAFYKNAGKWSLDSCERHSIFVSQAGYPIKGFHMVLEAMPAILQRYPDARLYTTGQDPFTVPFYRVNGYQAWLMRQIIRLNLRDRVCFLGTLDAAEMCQRFLESHVFVSASSIENSPNSVGEAMLLGVPTVASYVGGTMDLLRDGEEGFLYQPDAAYMLTDRVCKIFADDAMAVRMSINATEHAQVTHEPHKNLQRLMEIYREVCEQ